MYRRDTVSRTESHVRPTFNPWPVAVMNPTASPTLVRRLGLFDATMVVMGGIVGSGIFIAAYVVAGQVHTPALILGAWLVGGVVALCGAFIYAELADRMPDVGGQYAYLRDTYHPIVGFLYGWVLLLVVQTGGMAAVTVTFARYFNELTGLHADERVVAVITLAILTVVNCLGVAIGSRVQSGFMLLRIAAICGLIVAGLFYARNPQPILVAPLDYAPDFGLVTAFGAALIPVLFAYGGWQTSTFLSAEIKSPHRNLPRALLVGVIGVIILYTLVNLVYVRVLGPEALAATRVPASAVARLTLGRLGTKFVEIGIACSTVGFLSQSVLTAPRVYFAMAEDRVFFRSLAFVNRRTRVPVVAIIVQSVWTAVVALSGRFEQILNYVVSMDFLFFGLTASCIFVLRHREAKVKGHVRTHGSRVPGHPFTTAFFVIVCWLVVATTLYKFPANSLLGMAILLLGVPVYFLWRGLARTELS